MAITVAHSTMQVFQVWRNGFHKGSKRSRGLGVSPSPGLSLLPLLPHHLDDLAALAADLAGSFAKIFETQADMALQERSGLPRVV